MSGKDGMTWAEHLEDLRKMIIKTLAAFLAMIIGLATTHCFSDEAARSDARQAEEAKTSGILDFDCFVHICNAA